MWMHYIFYCSFFNLRIRPPRRKNSIYFSFFGEVNPILDMLRIISLTFRASKGSTLFYSKRIVYPRTFKILLSTLKPSAIQTSNKLMRLLLLILLLSLRCNHWHKLSNIDILRLMILKMLLLPLMVSCCYLPVRITNLRLDSLDWKTCLCSLL